MLKTVKRVGKKKRTLYLSQLMVVIRKSSNLKHKEQTNSKNQ